MNIKQNMKKSDMKKVVEFCLSKISIADLNRATKEYSWQQICYPFAMSLSNEFDFIDYQNKLDFGIKMSECFQPYKVNSIRLNEIDVLLVKAENVCKHRKKYDPLNYLDAVKEHNLLVHEYRHLIKPQNKLLRIARKIKKSNEH